MSTQPKPFITPEQYMEMEKVAPYKSQYLNGEIFAMAGGSEPHHAIASNLNGLLYAQLRGRGCRFYGSDMMVLVEQTGLRTYPDISGTCQATQVVTQGIAMLLNPSFLIEILSPSTEAFDRGEKFHHYRTIPTLREYVLVSSTRKHVDMYRKRDDGSWVIESGLESIRLDSVNATLTKDEIYERVEI